MHTLLGASITPTWIDGGTYVLSGGSFTAGRVSGPYAYFWNPAREQVEVVPKAKALLNVVIGVSIPKFLANNRYL